MRIYWDITIQPRTMFFLMDDWEYHGDTMGQNWDERVWKFLETADLGVLDIFGQLHVFFFETWGE